MAHAPENKVEAAYQRSDLLEKRRALMEDWSQFCSTASTLFGAGDSHVSIDLGESRTDLRLLESRGSF